jgi:hypothetical protein
MEFEEVKVKPELEYLKKYLVSMTNEYEKVSKWVVEQEDNEFIDFHARRLVEMAGNVIMGYLLLHDAVKNDVFETAAEIFIKQGKSENAQKADYITSSETKDLGIFRYV